MSFLSSLNSTLFSLVRVAKPYFPDYSPLDSAVATDIILNTDGSLLSVIEINGVSNLVTPNTFGRIVNTLNARWSNLFEKNGVCLQFCFSNNPTPEMVEAKLESHLTEARETVKRLKYTNYAQKILNASKNSLLGQVSVEKNFLLLTTTSGVLNAHELKELITDRKEKLAKSYGMGYGGNPLLVNKKLLDTHRSYMRLLEQSLLDVGVRCEFMTVDRAVHEMRVGLLVSPFRDITIVNSVDKHYFANDLSGQSELRFREYPISFDEILYDGSAPRLNEFAQIDVNGVDLSQVEVDGIYFQPMAIDMLPAQYFSFNSLYSLFNSAWVGGQRVPYRLMFTLNKGETNHFSLSVANLLRKSNLQSKLFYDGTWEMSRFLKAGGIAVGMKVHLLTWGRSPEETKARSEVLATKMESWGSPKVRVATGNPIQGLASVSMGMLKNGVAVNSVVPLEKALLFLPLCRPTALWESSSLLYRSPDGKIIPYQPFAPQIMNSITFVSGSSGSGKSVFVSRYNMLSFFAPMLKGIPYLSHIDFGFSSKGCVEMVRQALPPHLQNQVVYCEVLNQSSCCMNPHQLGLGLRVPSLEKKSWLGNFYGELTSDRTTGEILENKSLDLFEEMIQSAYEHYSDFYDTLPNCSPKHYKPNAMAGQPAVERQYQELDKVLKEHQISATDFMELLQQIEERRLDNNLPHPNWTVFDELRERNQIMIFTQENLAKLTQNLEVAGGDMARLAKARFRLTSWWDIVDFFCRAKPLTSTVNYLDLAELAQRQASITMSDVLDSFTWDDSLNERFGSLVLPNGSRLIDEVKERLTKQINDFPLFSGYTQMVLKGHYVSLDLEKIFSGRSSDSASDRQFRSLVYMSVLSTTTGHFFVSEDEILNPDFPVPRKYIVPKGMDINWLRQHHLDQVKALKLSPKRFIVDEFHKVKTYYMMKLFESYIRVVRKRGVELVFISQKLSDFVMEQGENHAPEKVDLLTHYSAVFQLSSLSPEEMKLFNRTLLKLSEDERDDGLSDLLQHSLVSNKENPEAGSSFLSLVRYESRTVAQLCTNKLSQLEAWNYDTTPRNMALRDALQQKCHSLFLASLILSKFFPPYQAEERVKNAQNDFDRNENLHTRFKTVYEYLADEYYKSYLSNPSYFEENLR